MKRIVFILLIFVIIIGFSYNAFAFNFIDEGFPKEPDHNKKWIMIVENLETPRKKTIAWYVETEEKADTSTLKDGYLILNHKSMNNGQPICYYRYNEGNWFVYTVGFQTEITLSTTDYKIYSNYSGYGEYSIIGSSLENILRRVNLVDVLSFGILILSVVVSVLLIKRIIRRFL